MGIGPGVDWKGHEFRFVKIALPRPKGWARLSRRSRPPRVRITIAQCRLCGAKFPDTSQIRACKAQLVRRVLDS